MGRIGHIRICFAFKSVLISSNASNEARTCLERESQGHCANIASTGDENHQSLQQAAIFPVRAGLEDPRLRHRRSGFPSGAEIFSIEHPRR